MKALYGYFGRMYDHNASIPSHPLYQLFLLKAISRQFGIDQFDICYYDEGVYNYGDMIYNVLNKPRTEIYDALIADDGIPLEKALETDYDIVLLKYRFRNYSRLRDGSLDRLTFDKLYNRFKERCYIIDTDAEVREPYEHIITYFLTGFEYPKGTGEVLPIVPVLKEDILVNLIQKLVITPPMLMFIGNEYFKVNIQDWFKQLKANVPGLTIKVQGKWNKHEFIDDIIDRSDRKSGYDAMYASSCSIQLSKDIYRDCDFLAPRYFESYLLSTIIFGQNSFMPKFSKFKTIEELQEKIKFLSEISPADYLKYLKMEIEEFYTNVNNKLKI
jgi:hypothetical protein